MTRRYVSKSDRERLASVSIRALAQNVIGIGQSMSNNADRLFNARSVNPDSLGASKSYEATQLEDNRAHLTAICDELRARIVLLRTGEK